MQKSNYSTTIAIDSTRSIFHFYSMMGNDKSTIVHNIKSYAGSQLDDDFFAKFKEAVKEFAENTPSEKIRKVTVVLPDNAVLTDTVRIPTMKGPGQTKKTLDITLGGLYRNFNDLRVVSHLADQNKQYSTFAIAAVKKNIITSIYAACSENKLLVDTLTYASSAAASGAALVSSKLKNASYLFLDIKDVYARFVFVANGKTVGYYNLPFGLEFLRSNKVTQEDMLFDHSYAELMVLNARERAKSKKLTIMALGEEYSDAVVESDEEIDGLSDTDEAIVIDEGNPVNEEEESADGTIEDATEEAEIVPIETISNVPLNQKIFTKKAPRKLPKFMLRPVAETAEEVLYENFRIFVKWALTLIQSNDRLVELGKPEFVYVNIPEDLANVLDKVNEEAEDNGVTFARLPGDENETEILSNLELYGGLFPKQMTAFGKF